MQYSEYTNGEKISKLGFGLMRLPLKSPDSDSVDFEEAERLLKIAIDSGINYFDTAYPYHGGESEEFVGKALMKYPRESFFLASKLPGWFLKTNANPIDVLEFQLNRCKTGYFDFYLLHSVTEDLIDIYKNTRSYELLREKKKEGVIKNLGFSFHGGLPLFEQLLSDYEWDFVQIQLNYYDWDAQNAKTLYKMLLERHIPCIVMEPVRGGSLHKLNDEARAALNALSSDASCASYALRFAAQLPNVLTTLSGMSDEAQLRDNIKTFSGKLPLSEAESEAVAEATVLFRKNFAVPCTACGYCVKSCPSGVCIPDIFSVYNDYNIKRDTHEFEAAYASIPEGGRADACVECGACTAMCPQKIEIPKKLKKIREMSFND